MGIPILLLIGVIVAYVVRKNGFIPSESEIVLILAVLFISTYFLFFLINLGQAETYIDRMTGAFNRESLIENLKRRVKSGQNFSVILFRIENLPSINDHFGIDRADQMLRIFTHLLDEFLKLHDVKEPIIGRYHGGDFILGLNLPLKKSLKLLEEFESTYKDIGQISLEYRYTGIDSDKTADLSVIINHLYDTISHQKNFNRSKEISEKKIDPKTLEFEIVEAIESEKLLLHYVPTLNTHTKEIDLFEVGVRLETANSGVIPPKKFIPVVNRLGMEKIFDVALFRAVCKDAKKVDEKIKFSFNISPFSLRNESFVESIKEIVQESGLAYDRFILELFENRALKDVKKYKVILDELKDLGVEFALDNFGALNASFEYIKRLPVDMVQFDKDFTKSYNNPKMAALLNGYIVALKNMEIKSLVKWVDNEEMLHRFSSLGVDYLQGFAVSNRPLDSENLIKRYGG